MGRRVVFFVVLLAFVVEVWEPSTAFVRADIISKQSAPLGFEKVSFKKQTAPENVTISIGEPSESQNQQEDAVIVSHSCGTLTVFKCPSPKSHSCFLFVEPEKLESQGLETLRKPPILA